MMTSNSGMSSLQEGFFNDSGELGGAHPQFAEICTALYERELLYLAHNGPTNLSILRRRLAGLPHHIRSVARYLMANSSPLAVDVHNASWVYKQPNKCPGLTQQAQTIQQWYTKHADYGLVVPILLTTLEGLHIELDSIDNINTDKQSLHSNKNGWFYTNGNAITTNDNEPPSHSGSFIVTSKRLLKPTTAILASACCGHTWKHKSKGAQRTLSLREMRLSTKINWKNFTVNNAQKDAKG